MTIKIISSILIALSLTTAPEIAGVYEYEATDKTQNHYLILEKVDGELKGKYFGTHDGRDHGVGIYFYKVDVEKLKLVENGEVEFEIGTRWLYESSQFKIKDPQKDSPMGRTSDVIQYKGQISGDVIKLTCYSNYNSCSVTEFTFKKIGDL